MIKENVRRLMDELPEGVSLVAAAKTRTPGEVLEAIDAGVEIIGHNYVQEAQAGFDLIGPRAKLHMIGHLQTNKVKKAVELFDMVETLDSTKLAKGLDRAAGNSGKKIEVLIEINSGEEPQKAGVMPAEALSFVKQISGLENISIKGLMTMGPYAGDPEDARPYFVKTKKIFDLIAESRVPGVEMTWLSMGMSNSYRVAVEEGANLVRVGTLLFGERRQG